MSQAQYLIDTSGLIRLLRRADLRGQWQQPVSVGLIATCAITELELLYTAQSKADREELMSLLRAAFGGVVMPERSFERATEIQAALTDRGSHRSAGPADLLTAAAAEAHGLILLHYDGDFVQVADVTGQPVQWIAEPGSID